MRIDAHQHYWKIERGDYGSIPPDITKLYRDYLPKDLAYHLHKHQIDQTILVQAAPTIEETLFLLELSNQTKSIAGVVGWLDLEDANFKDQFEKLRSHPKLVGIRLMIQGMEDARSVLQPNYIDALKYFATEDVPVDLLVVHHQLPVLNQLLEKVPGLRGVIDHIAKPSISSHEMEPWKTEITRIAKHNNIYCKLSGMITEANHSAWEQNDFVPYVRHVLDEFGADRLMYGSDWPVCLLAGSYDEVVSVLENALADTLTTNEKDKIFAINARQFYKLEDVNDEI